MYLSNLDSNIPLIYLEKFPKELWKLREKMQMYNKESELDTQQFGAIYIWS